MGKCRAKEDCVNVLFDYMIYSFLVFAYHYPESIAHQNYYNNPPQQPCRHTSSMRKNQSSYYISICMNLIIYYTMCVGYAYWIDKPVCRRPLRFAAFRRVEGCSLKKRIAATVEDDNGEPIILDADSDFDTDTDTDSEVVKSPLNTIFYTDSEYDEYN